MTKFEQLMAMLDYITLAQSGDWLNRLQIIRNATDSAVHKDEITEQEWTKVVSRSARIQDSINLLAVH